MNDLRFVFGQRRKDNNPPTLSCYLVIFISPFVIQYIIFRVHHRSKSKPLSLLSSAFVLLTLVIFFAVYVGINWPVSSYSHDDLQMCLFVYHIFPLWSSTSENFISLFLSEKVFVHRWSFAFCWVGAVIVFVRSNVILKFVRTKNLLETLSTSKFFFFFYIEIAFIVNTI